MSLSNRDPGQIIKLIYDEISGSIKITTPSAQQVAIDALDDSIAIGDGTNLCTVTSAKALKVDNSAVTQPISGTVTANVQGGNATAVKVDGSGVTQPVSGSVAVSNFPATQPVSGTVTADIGTTNGIALDATVSTMSAKLPAALGAQTTVNSLAVNIASDQTVPVSGTLSLTDPTSVSLGTSTGKTLISTHARFTSSSTSAVTVVAHTTTVGKMFYITGYEIEAYYTTPSSVAARLGDVSFQVSGSTIGFHVFFNSTTSALDKLFVSFPEPIPVPPGNAALIGTTPASGTSTAWVGNIYGYEK